MPQPLFVEITNKKTGLTFIAGLAHIIDITQDEDGSVSLVRSHNTVSIVETYDEIRNALGALGGMPR